MSLDDKKHAKRQMELNGSIDEDMVSDRVWSHGARRAEPALRVIVTVQSVKAESEMMKVGWKEFMTSYAEPGRCAQAQPRASLLTFQGCPEHHSPIGNHDQIYI